MSHNACSLFAIHSPSLSAITLSLYLPSLFAITLPQSPPPFSIILLHPFRSNAIAGTLVSAIPISNPHRTRHRWLQVRCSAVLRFCAAFVLWEMDDYERGISHYQNIQFFSICFVAMTQVQVLCREENMIISASYIFYYLKMCWKSSVWYCQNKWLLWKELRNSCIFEDSNWLKTRLESLLIRYIWLIGLVSGVLRNSNPLLDFT